MTTVLYFAFGSNLDMAQMTRRCPSAKKVANGVLAGYRLTFTGYSGGWGGATATIVPDKEGSVLGVVYELRDPEDVRRLDAYEGCPAAHECREFVVKIGQKKMRAWAYVKREAQVATPSEKYVLAIASGYKQHEMGLQPLTESVLRALRTEEKRTGRSIGWPPRIFPSAPAFTYKGAPIMRSAPPRRVDAQSEFWSARVVNGKVTEVNGKKKDKPKHVHVNGPWSCGCRPPKIHAGSVAECAECEYRAPSAPKKGAPPPSKPRFPGAGWDEDDVRGQWPW